MSQEKNEIAAEGCAELIIMRPFHADMVQDDFALPHLFSDPSGFYLH